MQRWFSSRVPVSNADGSASAFPITQNRVALGPRRLKTSQLQRSVHLQSRTSPDSRRRPETAHATIACAPTRPRFPTTVRLARAGCLLQTAMNTPNHLSPEELAAKITASTDGAPVETNLETSQRIIARVTDGIYREPWAAFRELVANAYDADASHVVIDTGAPHFKQMTVRDDGIGMAPETLAYVLKNIGGSSKRTAAGASLHTTARNAPDRSPAGRPLIGKIGIGLFAVAQLTQHFQIITKTKGARSRISATVRLRTHDDDTYTADEDNHIAGAVSIQAHRVPESDIDSHGTLVVLYSLRPEVRRNLQSARRWEHALLGDTTLPSRPRQPLYHIGYSDNGNGDGENAVTPKSPWKPTDDPKQRFQCLFDAARALSGRGMKSANLEHFDEYFRLIWKLSLSLPMDYIGDHPFDLDGSSGLICFELSAQAKQATRVTLAVKESLRDRFGFRSGSRNVSRFLVTLDGIDLRRPIRLPQGLAKTSRVGAPAILVSQQENPFASDDLARAGGPISFEAYLYWNSRILPKETAGALIRVREASGTLFDPTFLNYQVSEQTRLRQITAEIFIHTGLDSAINIDRESFNYSHPHFLFLQNWLHRALRLLVNRLKALASADLEQEKVARRKKIRLDRFARAVAVWHRRYGEDADPPLRDWDRSAAALDIGGTEITWPPNEQERPIDRMTPLAVVLEAYGALSSLPSQDRPDLLRDVLDVLDLPE